jgi:UDPglucose--hexose-1-phosphate uridylyltransferase
MIDDANQTHDRSQVRGLREVTHRRYNPLAGDWVLVSPHRTQRPWQGQVEKLPPEVRPAYDPSCYLCPGNSRAGGIQNPKYEHTFVFDNDFAALVPLPPDVTESLASRGAQNDLLQAQPAEGLCRVVCFSPRHDLTLAEMDPMDIRRVVDVWATQTLELGALPFIKYVQIFENRGAMMGASNPHPHGQIWSTGQVPNQPAAEVVTQAAYLTAHGAPMLQDYLALELTAQERLVCANEHFVALVPFWAVWPFETLVLPRRQVTSLPELQDDERDGLADLLKRLTTRYDNLFEVSFPYSMGWHQRPVDGADYPGWTLHAHFYPPLLRSATVRKFMVGFEMLGEPQRDIPAELAAARLREVSETHYRARED